MPTRPTGEQKQKKRTDDGLPKPDNFIRYRQVLNISLLQGRTVNSHCFCDLTVCVGRALKPRLGQLFAALKFMKSLRPAAQFAIESLRGPWLKNRSSKESIMLDVAFVVLGLAVLALMGAYAVGLRQL